MQRIAIAVIAGGLLAAVGCRGNGDFSLLGYSTAPPYDPDIRTVYIPVFKNPVYHTTPPGKARTGLVKSVNMLPGALMVRLSISALADGAAAS